MMTFQKLPKHYAAFLMPLILSLFMTCIVSAISIVKTHGFHIGFFDIWPSAWALSWIIAFPVLLIILPLVRRIVGMLVRGE